MAGVLTRVCLIPFQGVGQPQAGGAARGSEALHWPLLTEERAGPPESRGCQHAEREGQPGHKVSAEQSRSENVGVSHLECPP